MSDSNSNSKMVNVQLSAEELAYIEAKREEARIAAEAAKSKEEKAREAAINRVKADVIKAKKVNAEQREAVAHYFKGFVEKPGWMLVNQANGVVVTDRLHPEYREEYMAETDIITDGRFRVEVKEHHVWHGTRRTNNGYRMFLMGVGVDYKYSNIAVKSADTILKKVKEILNDEAYKKAQKAKYESSLEMVTKSLKSAFPTATVTTSKTSQNLRAFGTPVWETIDMVTIIFANKVSVNYRVYADGSKSRMNTLIPREINENDFLNALNNLSN